MTDKIGKWNELFDWNSIEPIGTSFVKLGLLKLEAQKAESVATQIKYNYYKGDPARTNLEILKKDEVANILRLLYALGYNIKKVDGVLGNNTRLAIRLTEDDGYVLRNGKFIAPNKNTTPGFFQRNSPYAWGSFGVKENIYPYDYNPAVSFDENNVKGYREFLDLDLSTPEGQQRAKEIRDMKQGDGRPVFSNRQIQDNALLQKLFRERYDLMAINSGLPLKYNSFYQYTDPDTKETFYLFSDNSVNRRYKDRFINSANKYTTNKNGNVVAYRDGVVDLQGNPVAYVPRDKTNVLFNQYTIKNNKDKGYIEGIDDWDIAPTLWLPGSKALIPRIRLRVYPEYYTQDDKSSTEEFSIPNSVYHKNSVNISDREKPDRVSYSAPFSPSYISEYTIKGIKDLMGF